jgi:hypothetical protein
MKSVLCAHLSRFFAHFLGHSHFLPIHIVDEVVSIRQHRIMILRDAEQLHFAQRERTGAAPLLLRAGCNIKAVVSACISLSSL